VSNRREDVGLSGAKVGNEVKRHLMDRVVVLLRIRIKRQVPYI
jgi:hypothetical protein